MIFPEFFHSFPYFPMILSSYKPPATDQVLGIGWYRYAPAWAPSNGSFWQWESWKLTPKKVGSDLVAW
jgi:hypothetical protein